MLITVSLILPKFIFITYDISSVVLDTYITEIKSCCFNFIWQGKKRRQMSKETQIWQGKKRRQMSKETHQYGNTKTWHENDGV